MEEILWLSEGSVPFYPSLVRYEWLPDFLRCRKIEAEIRLLVAEKKRLQSAAPSVVDLKNRLRAGWQEFQNRRILQLSKLIQKSQTSSNPLAHLEKNPKMQEVGLAISWEDIEAALELLAEGSEGRLDDSEKADRLDEVEKKIAELTVDLAAASPQSYFMIKGGAISCDSRQAFVEHWGSVQARCNAPCGPQAFSLAASSEVEQDAYFRLGIDKAPRGRLNPNRGKFFRPLSAKLTT